MQAQSNITFQGRVLSAADNEPLPGASVQLRGTRQGTTTDENGSFMFTVSGSRVSLGISFIGYLAIDTTLTLPLKQELVILLRQDANVLAGVTVSTGYWETSKRLSTGNISKVTAEVIEKQPVTNVLQALQGRMPGVEITQSSGLPGGSFTIRIRGQNSLRGNGNDPLYLINGVPFVSGTLSSFHTSDYVLENSNPLNVIDPADIESIEVLKDADATAIYGSRGANGVVLITTKKGRAQKLKGTISIRRGVGTLAKPMSLLNTSQYLEMRREAFENDVVTPTVSNAMDLLLWDASRSVDWQKELLGRGAGTTQAYISLSGGTEETRFLFSGGYHRETSVFPGNFAFRRPSSSLNLNHRSPEGKITISMAVNYTNDSNTLPNSDLTGSALNLPPHAPEFLDADGKLVFYAGASNPYVAARQQMEAKSENFNANGGLIYAPLKTLQFKLNGGYSRLRRHEVQTTPLSTLNPSGNPTQADAYSLFSQASSSTWILEPQLTYNVRKRRAVFEMLAGATLQGSARGGVVQKAAGYSHETLMKDPKAAASISALESSWFEYKYNSIYARAGYNLSDRYLVNLTLRRDGSSRFGPQKRFANFGAIGAAWIFSEEKLIRTLLSPLSFGKIRVSYGTTGSDQIGDYQYQELWQPVSYPYQNQAGVEPSRIANPYFSWEVNKKLEAAIDLEFLSGRIASSISWYNNRSSSQLVGYALPPSTGFSSIQDNLPALIQNTGLEVVLSGVLFRQGSFRWTTAVNFTAPRNQLLAFPELETSSYAAVYTVWKPLSVRYKYRYAGVDTDTGVYQFEDLNNDGTITPAGDRVFEKNVARRYYGGILNSLSWKGIKLDFLVEFVKQTGTNYMGGFNVPGFRGNQPTWVLDRWQQPGDKTGIQRYTQRVASPAWSAYISRSLTYGDNIIVDASYLRLKNISLSYTFDSGFIRKVGLNNLSFQIQGQNLLTITGYKGLDPESQSLSSLPPLRVVSSGLSINF